MNGAIHVLLAGDRDYAPYLLERVTNKCFLKFPSCQLLELTLNALAEANQVRALLIVGPEFLRPMVPRLLRGKPTAFLEQRESFSQNVGAALSWVQHHHPGNSAIFITNDAPLLTSAELDRFASLVVRQSADINIAVARIPKDTLEAPLVRQYIQSIVTLSDGLYLLANQVSLSAATIDLIPTLQAFFDFRKQSQSETFKRTILYVLKEWRNINAIVTWLRLLLAKRVWLKNPTSILIDKFAISLEEVESGLEQLIRPGLHVRINELPDAQGCYDADTQQQLNELRKVIELRMESSSIVVAANA